MALTTTYDIALRIAPLLRQPCSFLRGVSQFSGLAPRSLALPPLLLCVVRANFRGSRHVVWRFLRPAYAWRGPILGPRAT